MAGGCKIEGADDISQGVCAASEPVRGRQFRRPQRKAIVATVVFQELLRL